MEENTQASEAPAEAPGTEQVADKQTLKESLPDFKDYSKQYLESLSDQTQREFYEKNLNVINNWDNLIGGYVNAQKMIGSKVNLPGENSDQKEWDSFYEKLGKPKDVNAYDLGNEHFKFAEEVEGEIKGVFHQVGLNPKQAKVITDKLAEISSQDQNQKQLSKEQQLEEILNQRKEEFKENLEQAETEVDTFLRQLTDKQEYQTLSEKAKTDNAIFKLLHKAYNETAPKNPANVARNIQTNQTAAEYYHEFFKDADNKRIYQTQGYGGFPKPVAEKLKWAILNRNKE